MCNLKNETLKLVQTQAEKRGLTALATATGVPYHVLAYLVSKREKNEDVKIDADVCQTLYEHLTGNALKLVDHVQ